MYFNFIHIHYLVPDQINFQNLCLNLFSLEIIYEEYSWYFGFTGILDYLWWGHIVRGIDWAQYSIFRDPFLFEIFQLILARLYNYNTILCRNYLKYSINFGLLLVKLNDFHLYMNQPGLSQILETGGTRLLSLSYKLPGISLLSSYLVL